MYTFRLCIFHLTLTDESDYRLDVNEIKFEVNSMSTDKVCAAIHMLPDSLSEANEMVVVHLVPDSPDLPLQGLIENVTIIILNNDGMKSEV